jgi:hypothetical protein
MLEATATANNTNALRMAFINYKNSMDRIAGPNVTNYISHDEFASEHELHVQQSYRIFDSIANFGSNKSIMATRQQLMKDISSSYETYKTMNDGRNPLAGVEMYVSSCFVSLPKHCLLTLVCSFLYDWNYMNIKIFLSRPRCFGVLYHSLDHRCNLFSESVPCHLGTFIPYIHRRFPILMYHCNHQGTANQGIMYQTLQYVAHCNECGSGFWIVTHE